ncbi:pectate lyase [Reichenbachiella agarivorans]|uniref:Pectate lyase n=1 Tax=Reichenbachiella agarivorans TaxID=2979464 RepID=A0ABY6CPS1_9BACT|nr:pectate lyase [Reichenbachiella agarivorans]UXP32374.1 pectate lyase [Reichenbachiella agarivorans]
MKFIYPLLVLVTVSVTPIFAQTQGEDFLNMSWKDVATKMPSEWYGTEQAKAVAENVLMGQRDIGGWPKNQSYHHVLTKSERVQVLNDKTKVGATFDNGATITELKFLAKVYAQFEDARYHQAFMRGLDYIFESQYDNGGWPQFYPVREGKSVAYSAYITYNDDAMVSVMAFLYDIVTGHSLFKPLQIHEDTKVKAQEAFDQGVMCILNTQIVINGQATVWCAQHDHVTLAPAKAREYELPSFSGSESVGITRLLMEIDNPSQAVITAVNAAIHWFETHKIEGVRLEKVVEEDGRKNLLAIADPAATPLWARFYDLETEEPFFCDRDGIKREALSDISYERRNGYRWYVDSPVRLLKEYAEWSAKWN